MRLLIELQLDAQKRLSAGIEEPKAWQNGNGDGLPQINLGAFEERFFEIYLPVIMK